MFGRKIVELMDQSTDKHRRTREVFSDDEDQERAKE